MMEGEGSDGGTDGGEESGDVGLSCSSVGSRFHS